MTLDASTSIFHVNHNNLVHEPSVRTNSVTKNIMLIEFVI